MRATRYGFVSRQPAAQWTTLGFRCKMRAFAQGKEARAESFRVQMLPSDLETQASSVARVATAGQA
jgi:hypothetical protein